MRTKESGGLHCASLFAETHKREFLQVRVSDDEGPILSWKDKFHFVLGSLRDPAFCEAAPASYHNRGTPAFDPKPKLYGQERLQRIELPFPFPLSPYSLNML